MEPAEGSVSCEKFFKRVTSLGFTPKAESKSEHSVDDSLAGFDPRTRLFEYDPAKFSHFVLFHEKQHLIVYERAKKLRISLDKLFGGKLGAILESDAYLAELWICERYEFPKDFREVRRGLLMEYIHKARTALRNRERLRELATQVLGYDIQAQIEQYFS